MYRSDFTITLNTDGLYVGLYVIGCPMWEGEPLVTSQQELLDEVFETEAEALEAIDAFISAADAYESDYADWQVENQWHLRIARRLR